MSQKKYPCSACQKPVVYNNDMKFCGEKGFIFTFATPGTSKRFKFDELKHEVEGIFPEQNSKHAKAGYTCLFPVCSDACLKKISAIVDDGDFRPVGDMYEDDDEDDFDGLSINCIKEEIRQELNEITDHLCQDSLAAKSPESAVKLLLEALSVDMYCVPAWMLLADQHSDSQEQRAGFLKNAVESGLESLPEEALESSQYPFWLDERTRPYMRALYAFQDACWELGQTEESLEIAEQILFHNPNDNMGVRYDLVVRYLFLKRLLPAKRLLKQFRHDSSAIWVWSRVVLRILTNTRAQFFRDLKKAREISPEVESYLFGKKKIPKKEVVEFAYGSTEEAIYTAQMMTPLIDLIKKSAVQTWLEEGGPKNQAKVSAKKGSLPDNIINFQP